MRVIGNGLMRPPALLALAVPLLAGGGGGGSGGTAAAPLSVSATLPDGLTGTLAEDRATVPVGVTVTYTLTLANRTGLPITYRIFDGGCSEQAPGGSLVVTDAQGDTAYPLTGCGTTGEPGSPVTLAPGQSASASYPASGGYNKPGQYGATVDFYVLPGATGDSGTVVSAKTAPLVVTVQ